MKVFEQMSSKTVFMVREDSKDAGEGNRVIAGYCGSERGQKAFKISLLFLRLMIFSGHCDQKAGAFGLWYALGLRAVTKHF
jgi:hypothetical protein